MLNKLNFIIRKEKKFLEKIRYNKKGYYLHQTNKTKNNKVSVILPTYNAETTLKKTIDSIINQSIGFSEIELLIIDDYSNDQTRSIILDYAKLYANIIPVFLEKNSGAPSIPRNIGISLASGKYITFIDSDDWFHENGISSLYNLLEKTNDVYAVGKTIKVTDKRTRTIAVYNNWATRESISPFSIEDLFHHLSPTGRMIKRDFILKHNITFPNMKYAEDKLFFIDVLVNCKTISTSKDVIYYANRYSDNESLTTTTSIFEKTDTNIASINYVKKKNLPIHIESMVLNRLYGFDCIERLFNRNHFLKSKNKDKYFEKFSEVIDTTKSLDYDFTKYLKYDWQRILVQLFIEKRFDDIVTLIKWNKDGASKECFIENKLPYYKLPFDDYSKERIEMLASHIKTVKKNAGLLVNFNVYGDFVDDLNGIMIENRLNDLDFTIFPVKQIDENTFSSFIVLEQLDELSKASYAISLRYNDYKTTAIKMNVRNIIKRNKKKLDFYTTVADNLGLNVK